MALAGMLAEVTRTRLASGHLRERQSDLLDSDVPALIEGFESLVRSASLEVVLLTGGDPPAGPLRDLAVEIIALETASSIEYAEYPEQQVQGEEGRGYFLHQRAQELLGQLRAWITALGGVIPADGGVAPLPGPGLPRARFPERVAYPDPVQIRGFGTTTHHLSERET